MCGTSDVKAKMAHILTLSELKDTEVDMFTTVYIGNSQTRNVDGKMVTPRGYRLEGITVENRKCRVNLVGIGMGSKGTLTEEVRRIIAESDVLIGATRMLEGFREKKKCCYAEYLPEKIRAILDEQEEKTRCTVLFSGDTGFYSGAKKLADILKKDGYEVQIFPGISSVIYLAARVGKSWEDAKIISMHGRSQNFIYAVANHEKTFLILGKVRERRFAIN